MIYIFYIICWIFCFIGVRWVWFCRGRFRFRQGWFFWWPGKVIVWIFVFAFWSLRLGGSSGISSFSYFSAFPILLYSTPVSFQYPTNHLYKSTYLYIFDFQASMCLLFTFSNCSKMKMILEMSCCRLIFGIIGMLAYHTDYGDLIFLISDDSKRLNPKWPKF